MRLTTMTDYAMRILMYLGQHPDRLCTIAEMTACYGVSRSHLMKVTNRLARAEWIETIRGKNGGMRLAHPPEAIPLGEVVRDMENDMALVECLAGKQDCTLVGQCGLPAILTGALAQFMAYLNSYSLADLLKTMDPPGQPADPAPIAVVKPLSARSAP